MADAGAQAQEYIRVLPCAFGEMALIWRDEQPAPRLHYLCLPEERRPFSLGQLETGSCARIDDLAERIERMLAGEAITWDLAEVALERCTPFQRRVLLAEFAIPRGAVSTYGLIARHIGAPEASRAVGQALGKNPFPLIIPCHRAVRADGRLGGYRGGLAMKRYLLEIEGVPVSPKGRVLVDRYYYEEAHTEPR
jgi:methylated-DNA-[protein]-cysteine S-methyltransferase